MAGRRQQNSPGRGLHRFAIVTAAATFALIFVGGLVTSTGSALAVPDWPLSFGKFFPRMEGGVLYEHGHRMVAGAVAILALMMAVWIWRREPRAWVRRTAAAALGLVLLQALLGGLTVLLRLPLAIAVAHAGCAQAFFCLTVTLALFTNPAWNGLAGKIGGDTPSRAHSILPSLTALTTGVIYLQIMVGAVMRHMGAGLAIPDFPTSFGRLIPPFSSDLVIVNFAHRLGALIVVALVGATVAIVLTGFSTEPMLRRPALGLALLLVAQICLGAFAIWSGRAVVPTTAHVAIGAATLATSLALTLRCFHMLAPEPAMLGVQRFPALADRHPRGVSA